MTDGSCVSFILRTFVFFIACYAFRLQTAQYVFMLHRPHGIEWNKMSVSKTSRIGRVVSEGKSSETTNDCVCIDSTSENLSDGIGSMCVKGTCTGMFSCTNDVATRLSSTRVFVLLKCNFPYARVHCRVAVSGTLMADAYVWRTHLDLRNRFFENNFEAKSCLCLYDCTGLVLCCSRCFILFFFVPFLRWFTLFILGECLYAFDFDAIAVNVSFFPLHFNGIFSNEINSVAWTQKNINRRRWETFESDYGKINYINGI